MKPIPLEVAAQESVVTKVYTRRPKVVQIVLWYLDSGCSKHMTGDRSQVANFVYKFLDSVKFGNDQIAKIIRITTTNKVPLMKPIPLEVAAQESVVTKVYTRRPKVPKTNGSNSKPKNVKSMISNKTEPSTSRGSNTLVAPSSSSVDLRLSKLFCGIWTLDAPST
nr:integrase, catalytic region, zinc finger, CCHC-type, peptidase aspartic, catalytic [Tanacetum cinerariifolium]